MNSQTFMRGIDEMRNFFTSFKPSENQAAAWFKRLKNFDDLAMDEAVFNLTEHRKTTPGYQDLKGALIEASRRLYAKRSESTLDDRAFTKNYLKHMRTRGMVPVRIEGVNAYTFERVQDCYIDQREPWCMLEGFKVNRFKLRENSTISHNPDVQALVDDVIDQSSMF